MADDTPNSGEVLIEKIEKKIESISRQKDSEDKERESKYLRWKRKKFKRDISKVIHAIPRLLQI